MLSLPISAINIVSAVHKIRRTHQPSHLAHLIEEYKPQRTLQSSSQLLLKETTFQTASGCCQLRYVATKTWNSLPETTRTIDALESFRRQMKTILFRRSYCIQMVSMLPDPRIVQLHNTINSTNTFILRRDMQQSHSWARKHGTTNNIVVCKKVSLNLI